MKIPTILVVDDDMMLVEFVRAALEPQGYRVECAVAGDALPAARRLLPQLILLDIRMVGMDGVEISKRLRADRATARIPIIASSATRNFAQYSEMLADDRLGKPYALKELYSTIARWVPAA